uniref:Cornichon family AMPA receptor auxiliary protein 4 n=4 Tax=Galliformes TaxID=8976 RepID=A0A669PJN4_PHACC
MGCGGNRAFSPLLRSLGSILRPERRQEARRRDEASPPRPPPAARRGAARRGPSRPPGLREEARHGPASRAASAAGPRRSPAGSASPPPRVPAPRPAGLPFPACPAAGRVLRDPGGAYGGREVGGMESVVFIFSLIDCCALIFLSVYFIITLSDLECDYINARSCCSKLNKWVVPEVIGHAVVTVLMLISLHWFIFLLNLPIATWNIYRFIMVPSGNMGVFDPTEIHNRGQLKSHMKEAMIKLGFHLLCFFMYLYSMILALIND